MRKITITLLDEVSCHFDGLTEDEIDHVIARTGIMEKGAYMQASFKMKLWDGKVSLFDKEGFCYQYMIDEVLDILEDYGVDLSNADLVDERLPHGIPDDLSIKEDFILEETGFTLRDYQLNTINNALRERKGVIHDSMNAGKTGICFALSKALDPYIGSVIVVPNEILTKQTFELFEKSTLDAILLGKNIKTKDRPKKIKEHRHIIMTRGLFNNCAEHFVNDQRAIMLDEAHVFADKIQEVLRFDVPNFPVRIGLTGTLPQNDKLKLHKIFCSFGGGEISNVKGRYLIDQGYSSDLDIYMIQTDDLPMKDLEGSDAYDYSMERNYIINHEGRLRAVSSHLKTLPLTNTLVLCQGQGKAAERLSEYLNCPFINESTSEKDKLEILSVFDQPGESTVVGTFGTIGTGTSKDFIFRVVLLDAELSTKNYLQGIGRGFRLDGEVNHFDVLDISSNLKYGRKHQKSRMKVYRKEKYPYQVVEDLIEVGED